MRLQIDGRGEQEHVAAETLGRLPRFLAGAAFEPPDQRGVVARLGLVRGRLVGVVDQHFGPLPPGDVVGLAANPTVVARLTGADPESVRRVARTAPSPADLPPARELLSELAAVIGVEGAEAGWADAAEIDGSVRVERA